MTSDKSQVTNDKWLMTNDKWQVTNDKWQVTNDYSWNLLRFRGLVNDILTIDWCLETKF